jgi:hypothetical protein
MVELLAKSRGISYEEALELALSKIIEDYKRDGSIDSADPEYSPENIKRIVRDNDYVRKRIEELKRKKG